MKRFFKKCLLIKNIFPFYLVYWGKDLSFLDEPSIVVNIPKKFLKKNYYFKDWHQEIWSGADPSSNNLDSSISKRLFRTNGNYKESHTWGHIPHRNRKPLNLPSNF